LDKTTLKPIKLEGNADYLNGRYFFPHFVPPLLTHFFTDI